MSGGLAKVFVLPSREQREPELGYEALATELGLSVRFLRYRVSEGMPAHMHYSGRRTFLLSEVRPWLDQWQRKRAS